MSEAFEIGRDARGRLILKRPGQEDLVDVRIRRAFPWSNPSQYISVRSAEGKEVLLIEDLNALPPATREVVEQTLKAASFVPKIQHIDAIDTTFGFLEWQVQTDRGPAAFRVQEREDIRFLGDGRFAVKDADGNIYELPGFTELNEHSRRTLERVI